jgi:hypothetical protein
MNRILRKLQSLFLHSKIRKMARTDNVEKNSALLKPYFDEYIAEVSVSNMAASLELASTLLSILEKNKYRKLVDLGSGFSSFVFRFYANSNPGVEVYSVDDDAAWLEKTREYLKRNNMSDVNLLTLDQFIAADLSGFDCILHDLNFVEVRINHVSMLLSKLSANGILILDDMHKPDYRIEVLKKLQTQPFNVYDLRADTLDSFGRYSMIVLRK